MAKLLMEFIAWRWSPAVGLLAASTVYVFIVVVLVPSEIGIPVANAKFSPRTLGGSARTSGGTSDEGATAYATAASDSPSTPTQPTPVSRNGGPEFGRRGFSPRLDRPDPPPPPAPPPPPQPVVPAPVATTPGPISNIFSRIQGALRPGAAAAAAAALSAQQLATQVPTPPNAEPAAVNGVPQPPAPGEAPAAPAAPAEPSEAPATPPAAD